MRISLTVLVAAFSLLVNSTVAVGQTPRRPPPKRDRSNAPATREYASGTIVAIDVVEFDAYWRDASLSLAAALQPLADIASKPAVNDSLDEAKRRADAKAIAAQVRTLRGDATKVRRLWVVWVGKPQAQTVSFVLSENRRDITDDLKVGRSINSEMFAARIEDGFATKLTPLGDDDAAKAPDVKAEAAIIRGRWTPMDVKTVRARLTKEPKTGPIGNFDEPPWHDDAAAIKAIKVDVEEPKADAAGKSPAGTNGAREVAVRFSVPEGQGNFSKITFRLFEKNKDGTRGAQVGRAANGGDLIAWGYANRPALLHVPVTNPSASGYDVEIVAARYR